MNRRAIYFAAAVAAVLVPLALLRRTFSASPWPKADRYLGRLPSAVPPKEMAVFGVVTDVNHRVDAYGYRGGSFFEQREFSMAGTLVKHHQATCSSIPVSALTSRGSFSPCLVVSLLDILYAMEAGRRSIHGSWTRPDLATCDPLTHAHWDHASGLPDFPGVPVWVTS